MHPMRGGPLGAVRMPAAASMKLPMHTEHTRWHFGARVGPHSISFASRVTSSTTNAPGTISVSISARSSERID